MKYPKLAMAITPLALAMLLFGFVAVNQKPQLYLGGEAFYYDVADSPDEQAMGLSNREFIATDYAMLFVFEDDQIRDFWMKDMLVSLDILWLDSEYRVQHIERYLDPESYPESFRSKEPSRYVLEVGAGRADNVTVGDLVYVPKN